MNTSTSWQSDTQSHIKLVLHIITLYFIIERTHSMSWTTTWSFLLHYVWTYHELMWSLTIYEVITCMSNGLHENTYITSRMRIPSVNWRYFHHVGDDFITCLNRLCEIIWNLTYEDIVIKNDYSQHHVGFMGFERTDTHVSYITLQGWSYTSYINTL